jgi:hypothetical protein
MRWPELIVAIAALLAGLALDQLGGEAYSGVATVAVAALVLGALIWISNRRVDQRVVRVLHNDIEKQMKSVADGFTALQESVERSLVDTRVELFEHWRSFSTSEPAVDARVVTNMNVLGLEATSAEVWIWAYKLTWEIEDERTLETVRSNLQRGVSYKYILPKNSETFVRVRQFQDRLSLAPDQVPLTFKLREDTDALVDQCITL